MKSGLYYHPIRFKETGSPLITNDGQYEILSVFIQVVEELAPECVEELAQLHHKYEIAHK